jgi:type I restriction enzyme S subunit
VCGPELDPFFLAYALRSSRGYLRGLSSGAVHKTIYMPTLKSLQVCMPPLEEQRRIVCELDAQLVEADRLQVALARRREQLEQLPSAILRSAFTPPAAAETPTGAHLANLPPLVHA